MTPPAEPENPTLKLDAKGLLDFIDAQSRKEREYFDRILKWLTGCVAVIVAVVGYFGYQNYSAVQNVSDQIREETKKQLSTAVNEELTKDKVQDQIGKALQQKTDAQFQDAINKAVASELSTPERQRLLQAATQRQVDIVARHLQDREKTMALGDEAIGQTAKSGPALTELRRLWKNFPEGPSKEAARGEIAKVMSFWGSGATYVRDEYRITTLNGKPVQESALTTCDLLVLLRSSNNWKDRVRSADILKDRREQNVPDALIHAMSDDHLNVVIEAVRSFRDITGRFPGSREEVLPEPQSLREWWSKDAVNITTPLNLKAGPECTK